MLQYYNTLLLGFPVQPWQFLNCFVISIINRALNICYSQVDIVLAVLKIPSISSECIYLLFLFITTRTKLHGCLPQVGTYVDCSKNKHGLHGIECLNLILCRILVCHVNLCAHFSGVFHLFINIRLDFRDTVVIIFFFVHKSKENNFSKSTS